MEERNLYGRVVDLRDLIGYILRRWKRALLVGVIFALLFPAVRWYRSRQITKNPASGEEAEEKDADQLDKDGRAAIETSMQGIRQQLSQLNRYLSKSEFMKLDPYHVNTVKGNIWIRSGDTEDAELLSVIEDNCINQAYGSEFLKEIAGKMNLEEGYVRELFYLMKDEDYYAGNSLTDNDSSLKLESQEDESNRTVLLHLTVYGTTASRAELLYRSVSDGLSSFIGSESRYRRYELSCGFSTGSAQCGFEAAVLNLQNRYRTSAMTYSKTLTELSAQLAGLSEADSKQADTVENHISKKTVVKGFIFGVLLVALISAFCYFTGRTLRTADGVKDQFRLHHLGDFEDANRRIRRGLDGWLDQVFRPVNSLGREENGDRIMAAIGLAVGEEEEKEILFTGEADGEKVKSLMDQLGEAQHRIGVKAKMIWLPDPVHHAETMIRLSDFDGVVLTEQIGRSAIRDIEDEINMIRNAGPAILGYICVE
ncbi:MAG: hypothetical protein MR671_06380 [Clostridiales bacterium]|nr:hypothetical protein [Clostridiales bacterium]